MLISCTESVCPSMRKSALDDADFDAMVNCPVNTWRLQCTVNCSFILIDCWQFWLKRQARAVVCCIKLNIWNRFKGNVVETSEMQGRDITDGILPILN